MTNESTTAENTATVGGSRLERIVRGAATRVEWTAKMAAGFICYLVLMKLPSWEYNRLRVWLVGLAGFYAMDDGYINWRNRYASNKY